MACSKFEYVKQFETVTTLLKNTFIVVRIDGHSFHNFTKDHNYAKPNDERGLNLMNHAAKTVMQEFQDIIIAYGESDEYSFVFKRNTNLWGRREAKIQTNLVSLFTAAFVKNWSTYFEQQEMKYLPTFDARCVLYPTKSNLRDYLSWRQADCHINNLYNTAFWELVLNSSSKKTEREAEAELCKTDSGQKNEILFKLGINYNELPEMFRKGSIITRELIDSVEVSKYSGQEIIRKRKSIVVQHCDLIKDEFWDARPSILD
jgi:tRNA(His) guanylyltransferase